MIIGLRDKDWDQRLLDELIALPIGIAEVPETLQEKVHEWMPGVKSIVALPYLTSLDAAVQTLPAFNDGRAFFTVEELQHDEFICGKARVWHPSFPKDAIVTSINPPAALVIASIFFRILNR